jgi:Peptidase family S41
VAYQLASFAVQDTWRIMPLKALFVVLLALTCTAGASAPAALDEKPPSPSSPGWEKPRALTDRGLTNLHAFARLLGLVRYFHPSDQAAAADWSKVAIAGVQHVEGAPDARALAAALRDTFAPLAPTLRIYETGTAPPRPLHALEPVPGAVIIGWRHKGVDVNTAVDFSRKLYQSARVTMTDRPPDQVFIADLGGGVLVLVPVRLYKDQQGTLPHTATPVVTYGKPDGFVPSGQDRSTRLADVMLAWNVYQHFYPDFEEQPVDLSATLDDALRRAATDRNETEFLTTLSRLSAATMDGHGFVSLESRKVFLLPILWRWMDGELVVIRAPEGSDLKAGDIVDRVDERAVADIVTEQKPSTPAPSPQAVMSKLWWAPLNVTSMAAVSIDAHRPGTAHVHAMINPVDGPVDENEFDSHKPVEELKPGIWYVDLRRVTDTDLDGGMADLAKAKAVIFDMRGYPTQAARRVMAHLSAQPIHTQDLDAPISTLPDHQGVTWEHEGFALQPVAPEFAGHFVFLTNIQAISASEMLMGMADDNHLGTIVGTPTFGVDGDINPFVLPGGYYVSWSGLRARRYGGGRFIGIGILPTVAASPTPEGLRAGRDEVLEKGLAVASAP